MEYGDRFQSVEMPLQVTPRHSESLGRRRQRRGVPGLTATTQTATRLPWPPDFLLPVRALTTRAAAIRETGTPHTSTNLSRPSCTEDMTALPSGTPHNGCKGLPIGTPAEHRVALRVGQAVNH